MASGPPWTGAPAPRPAAEPLSGPVLVADIGGTNARLALGVDGRLTEPVVLPTAEAGDAAALLADALARLGGARPSAAVLSLAGPVDGGRGRLTNGSLAFDADALARQLACPVRLINDFQALARALPELDMVRQLGGGAPQATGVRAVLGPGSGLGMALLVPTDGGWQVVPSEGGHADLAPGSALEQEIVAQLRTDGGAVSWEFLLSGPGLSRLHGALSALWGGIPGEPLTPAEIVERGRDAADPLCHQTLDLFFGLLGAAAGNLCLVAKATGGVYLGGGIVPRLADFAVTSPLRRRFEERAGLAELVAAVPLFLILDSWPGLTGALAWSRTLTP